MKTFKNSFLSVALLFAFELSSASEEDLIKLIQNNNDSSELISKYFMDCSRSTALCRERDDALNAESLFNELFGVLQNSTILNWPNNEWQKFKDAYNLRKKADLQFENQFFGDAAQIYKAAAEELENLLISSEKLVSDLKAIAKESLDDEYLGPEVAKDYVIRALLYSPDDEELVELANTINYLLDRDEKVDLIEDLIESKSFQEAKVELDALLSVAPNDRQLVEIFESISSAAKKDEYQQFVSDVVYIGLSLDEKIKVWREILDKVYYFQIDLSEDETQDLTDLQATVLEDIVKAYIQDFEENIKIINEENARDVISQAQIAFESIDSDILNEKIEESYARLRGKGFSILSSGLYDSVSSLIKEDNWEDAKKEIDLMPKDLFDDRLTNLSKDVTKYFQFLSNIQRYINQSEIYLNTKQGIDSAEKLRKDSQNFNIKYNSKNLDAVISELGVILDTFGQIVENDSRRSKNKPKNNTSNNSRNNNQNENIGNRISPKLKTNTFIKNVKCSRPISNRAFRFEFLIRVDVNGNVVSIDYADKRKYDNLRRTHKQAAQVIKNALERASYSPGTISNLVAEMEYIQTISISENLC